MSSVILQLDRRKSTLDGKVEQNPSLID